MKILFVCTGNTCRSPMAEALANKIFAERGVNCEFASGGVSVLMALPPSDNAIAVMEKLGLDISDKKTRQIMKADIDEADLLLTMTERHKEYLKLQIADADTVKKIHTLNEYVGIGGTDIADPFGGSLDTYLACAAELQTAVIKLAEKVSADSKSADNENTVKKIALGCDHGGLPLMKEVIKYLDSHGLSYKNFGTETDASCDYPDYAHAAAGSIVNGECDRGILICTTGLGISMAANRHRGIRAAVCHDVYSAKATREHNDANILVMGARVIGVGSALEVLKAFLETDFSREERHQRRIDKIELQEGSDE